MRRTQESLLDVGARPLSISVGSPASNGWIPLWSEWWAGSEPGRDATTTISVTSCTFVACKAANDFWVCLNQCHIISDPRHAADG
eukprot:6482837-Pyramimonas_sp.AAC.2